MVRRVGVLAGVSVVELGGMGPGPFAGMMLADHGAEVTVLKRPQPAARVQQGLSVLERGKRVEAVDLKSAAGRERALELVAGADVSIEGFRPGSVERLGLGPADCRTVNPRLVYGRMTGWGQDGPLAQLGGHDINYIALAGYLAQVGREGAGPTPPLNIVGDFGGGGMMLAFGIMAALFDARRTGRGRIVDAAMVDGVALLMAQHYAPGRRLGPRGTNVFDSGAPFYDVYPTADGGYMAVGATGADLYAELLRGLGLDPAQLPGQLDRAGWPTLRERLRAAFATRTRDEWAAVFADLDAAVTPVLDPYEAPRHSHHRARGTFIATSDGNQPAPAPRFYELDDDAG
ncbi:MAG: CaiB/BaiF CoA-transferase family protein [Trebonia sp.]